jgi:coenzyme F420-reducing hydrogenase beta subunit
MKIVCDPKQCTGCTLCAARCPKQCISMKVGNMGHLYPDIDQTLCIDCGLCQRGCPSLHEISAAYPQKAYAAWAKDSNEYKTSTSGGAAAVLSHYIISKGGVVYGCSVLPNAIIEHVRIDKDENLYLLKGSKYVQSSIRKCIPLLKKDVKDGRAVLFIGTPCQIAAIKQMYKAVPENLFLVDIICHGTPSAQYLRYYLRSRLHLDLGEISNIKFRLPDAFALQIFSKDKVLFTGQNLWTHRYEDEYYNLFIDGYTYRKSCFSCHYAKPERISDITIGDFWGLGKKESADNIPEHKDGVSCILPITDKGLSLVQQVSERLNIYERPVDEAINGNDQLRSPKQETMKIKIFQSLGISKHMFLIYKLLNFRRVYLSKQRIKKLIKK